MMAKTTEVRRDGASGLRSCLLAAATLAVIICTGTTAADENVEATPPGWSEDLQCASSGCHASLLEGKSVHEAAVSGCDICHEEIGDHVFELLSESEESCLDCHDDEEGNWIHADGGAECLDCHLPHSSKWNRLLTMPVTKLCQDCHGLGEENGLVSVHPPVREGRCLECHHPHRVKAKPLLAEPVGKLCVRCHKAIVHPGVENPEPHGGDEPDGCSDCHAVHESEEQALLLDRFAETAYTTDPEADFALCFGCHDVDDLLVSGDTGFISTDGKNLHGVHVLIKGKGRGCRVCHRMHANDLPHMGNAKRVMGRWTAGLDLVVEDGTTTCLPACHEPRSYGETP